MRGEWCINEEKQRTANEEQTGTQQKEEEKLKAKHSESLVCHYKETQSGYIHTYYYYKYIYIYIQKNQSGCAKVLRNKMTSLAAEGNATATEALLHQCRPSSIWSRQQKYDPEKEYFPATYEQDGFTHLTNDASLLLDVANHFIRTWKAPFYALSLMRRKLEPR